MVNCLTIQPDYDPWQRDVAITPATWTRNQTLGADMPQLDYVGQTIDDDGIIRTRVIFHSYFGLFVYDTKEQEIIFSLDLKAIGCDRTQGDSYCEVAVNETGDVVTLHPMDSETMYVLTLWDDNVRLFETPRDDTYIVPFRTVAIETAFPTNNQLGLFSDRAAKFSAVIELRNGAGVEEQIYYGYLHFNDGTLGGIQYIENEMGFWVFR